MWIRQNEDTTYTMCNGFSYWDGISVISINTESDKRRNYSGFTWEGDQAILDGYTETNRLVQEAFVKEQEESIQ